MSTTNIRLSFDRMSTTNIRPSFDRMSTTNIRLSFDRMSTTNIHPSLGEYQQLSPLYYNIRGKPSMHVI